LPLASHPDRRAALHDRKALAEAITRHVQHEDARAYDGIVQGFWLNLASTTLKPS
jgi:hypothetical protein